MRITTRDLLRRRSTLVQTVFMQTVFIQTVLAATIAALAMIVLAGPAFPSTEVSAEPLPAWQVRDLLPSPTVDFESLVWDFAEIDGVIYVAGRFGSVAPTSTGPTTSQPYLAAFDADTGDWIPGFTPRLNAGAFALAVSPSGSLLVGGEFTTVNGVARGGLVALNPTTGATDASFDASVEWPGNDFVVMSVEVRGADIFVGGNFSTIVSGGTSFARNRIAKLSATGALAPEFNAAVGGARVFAMDISPDGSRLYLGGYFSSVNGAPGTQWFGAINTGDGRNVTGIVTPEDSYLGTPICCGTNVFDIASSGDRVYLATESHNLIVLDGTDLDRIGFYHAQFGGGDYQAAAVVGDRLYAGGHYWASQNYDTERYDPAPRNGPYRDSVHVAADKDFTIWASAYEAATGAAIDSFTMDIGASSGIWAIHGAENGSLWLGGDITRAGHQGVGGFARFSTTDDYLARGPNLEVGASASQSSVSDNRGPEHGIDGLIGLANLRSDARTTFEDNPWWEVDLQSVGDLGVIRVWASSQCCFGVLNDAVVFVSDQPFASDDPAVLRADSAVSAYELDRPTRWIDVNVFRSGRYVRVQREAGNAQLTIDEIEVFEALELPNTDVLTAPIDCAAEQTGDGTVEVTWTAANGVADAHVIRRSRNGGTFQWAGRVLAPASNFTNTNVPTSAYEYQVEARLGAQATERTTCTPVVDVQPQGLQAPVTCTATIVGDDVRIDWTVAADDGADRYIVRRSRDGGTFFWAGAANAPTTTATNVDVAVGPTFTYAVESRTGATSSARTTCTPDIVIDDGELLAPASCTTSAAGTNVTVDWVPAADDNADAYVIRRSRDGGTAFWAGRVDAPATTFANAPNGTGTFEYSVEARRGGDVSGATLCTPQVNL